MRPAFVIIAVVLLGSAGRVQAQTQQQQQTQLQAQPQVLPEAISWRQSLFSIPFKITPARDEASQPVEVRLFVSDDLGGTWRLESRVPPQQGGFTFQAPRDNEYWFAIRTVDRQGRQRPENNPGPELRVIVDTQPPQIDLSAVRGESGEVIARWQIADPQLNTDSLKIEYRADPQQPWRSVAIDPSRSQNSGNGLTGQVPFYPPEQSPTITIRAEVSDRAGNPAITQINVPPRDSLGADRVAQRVSSSTSTEREWSGSGQPRPGGSGAGWPAEETTRIPLGRDPLRNSAGPPSMSQSYPDTSAAGRANVGGSLGQPPSRFGNAPISVAQPPDRPFGSADAPITGRFAANSTTQNSESNLAPPGEEPRRVNSSTFEMEYDVDSIGPSGVAKVEIWGTRDGGRAWTSYGVDPDNRSPIKVAVEGEGLYGFRMAIQSGSGIGGRPPQSGELPEIWIAVDLTKPFARLTAAESGAGPRAGELVIQWEASDNTKLAARPISLSFSRQLGGPWTTLAAGLENSGTYVWRFDDRAPEKVFLRLEARDEAGNVTFVEPTEPVLLDHVRPAGRIRNVRPVSDTSSQTRTYQLWR